MEPGLHRFDARDYLRVLLKRKWFVIIVAIAATIIGGLYAVSYPKTYRASTEILIRHQQQPLIWVGEGAQQAPQRKDLALDTQARIAASYDTAERAAKTLASRTAGDAIHVNAAEIAASINATPRDPDLLRIESIHRQENFAIAFANEVARSFEAISRELRRTESRAAKEFLEEALRRARGSLDQAQAEAARFQEEAGIVAPEAEARTSIEQLNGYRNSVYTTRHELEEAKARVRKVRSQLATTPSYLTERHDLANPARQALLAQLQANQIALAELRARYTDNWPEVREMRRRIEQLQAELARQPETISTTSVQPDGRITALRAEVINSERSVAELTARLGTLQRTVTELEARNRALPAKLSALQRLLDRAEMSKLTFQNVMAQLENARLTEAMKQADAEIINHAATAEEISPKLGRMLIFSFMLGIAAGIALAMLLEALDDTIHSPEDVTAYTNVTFLGMIPMLEEASQELITVIAPKSPPAEAYRTLRSNIHFAQVDSPARTFLVTSAGAGEGKTVTTANVATVFAQAGSEVLLVDTDLRRPSLNKIFGVSAERGLTNVLVGEAELEDVIHETEVPGLSIVTTGPLPPNPAELLDSERMTHVITRAAEIADYAFFDSPPAIVLTDAVILSSKIERTLLVAEAGQVSRDAFNEMTRLITNARGSIIGVVLNKLRLSASDYYYYYYYYDYSHYAPKREPLPGMTEGGGGTTGAGYTAAEAPSMLDEIFGQVPEEPVATPPVEKTPEPPAEPQQPATSGPEETIKPKSPLNGLFTNGFLNGRKKDKKGKNGHGDTPPPAPPPPVSPPPDSEDDSPLADLFGPSDEK